MTPDLATVTRIRETVMADAHPRALRHLKYCAEPNIGRQPIAHLEWTIETYLGYRWDADEQPWGVLALFPPQHHDAAEQLLIELFDLADEICEHGEGIVNGEAYDGTLYRLAQLVRDVVIP